MLRNPECQERVHKELDQVVGRDRLPSYNDKQKCANNCSNNNLVEIMWLNIYEFIFNWQASVHFCCCNGKFPDESHCPNISVSLQPGRCQADGL